MDHVVDPSGYEALAEHLPRGKSLRTIARELGRNHETVRQVIARDADRLVETCERHLRAGCRRLLFECPYGAVEDLAQMLTLATYATDELRRRGWSIRSSTVREPEFDGVVFALHFIEEEEPES